VTAAALANRRFIEGERGNRAAALAANARLDRLTARWNTDLAGGKWRHMMAQEPADAQWRSFRLSPWRMPAYAPAPEPAAPLVEIEAERFDARRDTDAGAWEAVAGLGTGGEGGMAMIPATSGQPIAPERIAADAPRLDYRFRLAQRGAFVLQVQLLPTHAGGGGMRLAVAVDDGPLRLVELAEHDGDTAWTHGVLDNARTVSVALGDLRGGAHALRVYGLDRGVVIDRLGIEGAGIDQANITNGAAGTAQSGR